MTSSKPDPITDFLQRHRPEPLSKKEERKLKDRMRKRKNLIAQRQLEWRDPEQPTPDDPSGYNQRDF
jgi:hypothetical protein